MKKLLYIVEDNRLYLRFLMNALKNDFDIQGFTTAEDCLNQARKKEPDIIITDYYLPGMNGFDLLQELKDDLGHTRFILLSAMEDGNLVLKLIQKGIRNYVVKDEEVMKNIFDTLNEYTYQY